MTAGSATYVRRTYNVPAKAGMAVTWHPGGAEPQQATITAVGPAFAQATSRRRRKSRGGRVSPGRT